MAYLIHDGSIDIDGLLASSDQLVEARLFGNSELPGLGERVLLYLNDDSIKMLWNNAAELQWQLGILPHPQSKHAARAFCPTGNKLPELFNKLLNAESRPFDSLSCNGTPVFSSIIVGELLVFNLKDTSHALSRWQALTTMLGKFRQMQLHAYELITATEQRINLALLGMMVLEQRRRPWLGGGLTEVLDPADRRLSLVAVAPRSVVAFLLLMLRFLFQGRINPRNLPDSIGLLKTRSLTIRAATGVNYQLDGLAMGSKELVCEIHEKHIQLLQPDNPERNGSVDIRKDQLKMAHLPCGSAVIELADKPIPVFHHASEDEFRDLFRSLRENAQATPVFYVLMVLSVLLAVTGLFANSAPVIIGAMILAPMMAPIISLAMGLARADSSLLQNAAKTLFGGIALALCCAILVTWLMPLSTLTPEMRARLTPTLLDLGVAVISGIAGAYANAKEEVAKSLAGVAIAVALVPPLSVVGIGLGWGDLEMAGGAILLFSTNLVGIALSAALTFLVLGFAPFHLARKGMGITLASLAIISIPLFLSFQELVDKNRLSRALPHGEMQLLGDQVELTIMEISTGDVPLISVRLVSAQRLDAEHLLALKQMIGSQLGRDVQIEAEIRLRQ
ncbi:TIGR00341 family protein [Bowmanella sp. Y26]|uniref:TIGR00341 family protein n=1 Tax=Bowmanella yangjiangensis TaxID=2811230 RepID=UPI001BDC9FC4|nr:TIGR00341 family protein [Bowmanella yangjiangensis]MBT1064769.1 TIGR00341 family protein [Bowmanella yangjiangensis]